MRGIVSQMARTESAERLRFLRILRIKRRQDSVDVPDDFFVQKYYNKVKIF